MPHNSSRLALIIILSGFFYLFFANPWSSSSSPVTPKPVFNLKYNTTSSTANDNDNDGDHWCTLEECASGHWTPRQPPFTSLSQFREAYHSPTDQMWEGCPNSAFSSVSSDPEERRRMSDERLMQVMNWTWTPYTGRLRPWDAEDFVVRLLRSPGGLILIGDSLTRQHQHTIEYYLSQSNFTFIRNNNYNINPNPSSSSPPTTHKNIHQTLLDPSSPTTHRALLLSGAPRSRLLRPILTLLEDHMLIGQRDIRRITERVRGAARGGGGGEYYWYHDFQRVPGWEEVVREAARRRVGEEGEGQGEDTVVVMNAGAHWSRHELSMLPNRPDRDRQAGVKEVYRQMIKLVTTRLSPIPHLTILYRSTSPGHPGCETHDAPYANSIVAREAERRESITPRLKGVVAAKAAAKVAAEEAAKKEGGGTGGDGEEKLSLDDRQQMRARWDWDLFEGRNGMWRRVVEGVMRERAWRGSRVGAASVASTGSAKGGAVGNKGEGSAAAGARWVYLDLWDMDLQRPDAHAEPGGDCLHWCRPSVLNEWTRRVYHAIKELPREE